MTTLRGLCCPRLHNPENPPNNNPRSILDEHLGDVCDKIYPYVFAGLTGIGTTVSSVEITRMTKPSEISSFAIQFFATMMTGISFSCCYKKKFALASANLFSASLATVALILIHDENFNLRNTGAFFGAVAAVLFTLSMPHNLIGARAELAAIEARHRENIMMGQRVREWEIEEIDRLPYLQDVLGEGGLEELENDLHILNGEGYSIELNDMIQLLIRIREQEDQGILTARAREQRQSTLQKLRRLRDNTPRILRIHMREDDLGAELAAIELENENIRRQQKYSREIDELDRFLGEGGLRALEERLLNAQDVFQLYVEILRLRKIREQENQGYPETEWIRQTVQRYLRNL